MLLIQEEILAGRNGKRKNNYLIQKAKNSNAIGLYKSLRFEDYETTMIKEVKE